MSRDVVIGGEGLAVINGVDWEMTDLSLTENETSHPDTCTSNFDATEKMTYMHDKTTARRLEGEVSIQVDRNKRPWGNSALRAGAEYACTLRITNDPTPYTITGTFKVGSFAIRSGGVEGLSTATFPLRSQGKYTINGA